MSTSLVLGPCFSPVSRLWRRPTLCVAVDTGVPMLLSWTYFLPVSGVDTFRVETWEQQNEDCLLDTLAETRINKLQKVLMVNLF